MTTPLEPVWVIRGQPADPSQDEWPVVAHDLQSRRLRYQMAPRYIALALGELSGMSKMSARWCPNDGKNGRWQLVDILPDNAREVA
jgi:hypothetical protein